MFKSFCKNLLLHCDHRQDVPDDELVADLFCEALKDSGPCSPPPWVLSGRVDVPGDAAGPSYRALGIHLSGQLMSEGRTKELLLLTGNGLNRFIFICLLFEMSAADIVGVFRFHSGGNAPTSGRIPEHRPCEVVRRSPGSAGPGCTVPVQREEAVLRVRRERHTHTHTLIPIRMFILLCYLYARCKRCSEPALTELCAEGVEVMDEKTVAEGET